MRFVCFQDSSGLQENIFHRLVALKMEKTWYFSDIFLARKKTFYKISSYQGFTSKQTLILVSPLSFKNSNP